MLLEFDIGTPLIRDRFDLPRDSFYITWFWVRPGTGFHYLFREFTINSLSFSQIQFDFTYTRTCSIYPGTGMINLRTVFSSQVEVRVSFRTRIPKGSWPNGFSPTKISAVRENLMSIIINKIFFDGVYTLVPFLKFNIGLDMYIPFTPNKITKLHHHIITQNQYRNKYVIQ